jgi:SAM-dependent methyltransferase
VLAPATLPAAYAAWNREHGAPFGRRLPHRATRLVGPRHPLVLRYRGPYGWQQNSSIRRFEYPWAFDQIQRIGRGLTIVDVGAGMSGLQFTLARERHRVIAVDPGMAAKGKGWALDADFHARLARTYRAPVELRPTTIGDAGIADASVDVLLSVSAIEHFAEADLDEFAIESRRILKPGGHLVLTIDLFIDVHPFTAAAESNKYGRNVDLRALLDRCGASLVLGEPAELHGFRQFDHDTVLANLSRYMIGQGYPSLSQCLLARRQ